MQRAFKCHLPKINFHYPNQFMYIQVDKRQFEKILSYIEHGKREGATLLTGGKTVGNKGYYIEPTVFADVNVNFQLLRTQVFSFEFSMMKINKKEECEVARLINIIG